MLKNSEKLLLDNSNKVNFLNSEFFMQSPSMRSRMLRRNFFLLGGFLIAVFWATLYLPHLRISPKWYGDEILTLDIGKSLTHGELSNRSVYCTFFSPGYNYQLGYALLTGLFSRLTNGDILGGRLFAALIGLFVGWTGFYFISRKIGFLWGMFFAFLLLGYSQSIIHYRWIYPHDAVGLGVLGATLLLMRPAQARSDWRAGCFLAVAAGSHLLAIHATATSLLCRIKRPASWIRVGFPPFLIIGTSALIVWLHFHGWLFEDLGALRDMYGRYSLENGGGAQKFLNFSLFFLQDYFHVIALIGCLLCLRKRTYVIPIMVLTLVFLLTQNRRNLPLFYYQAMTVLPVLAVAITFGTRFLVCKLNRIIPAKGFFKRLIESILVVLMIANGAWKLPSVLSGNIVTRVDPWVVTSSDDYDTAADWINNHTTPDDLVITYWTLGWLLKCHNADILAATAWSGGIAGDYYPTPTSRERYRWDADISKAKYFILTELDQKWALAQGDALKVLQSSGIEGWPIVYECGSIKVFENPHTGTPR